MADELPGAGRIKSFIYRHAPTQVQEWMQDNATIERVAKAIDHDAKASDRAVEAPAQRPSAFDTVFLPRPEESDTIPLWLREYNQRTGIGRRGNDVQIPDLPTRAEPEVRESRHDEIMRKLRDIEPRGPDAKPAVYKPTQSPQYIEEHRYHEKTSQANVVEFKPPTRDSRQHSWDWGR